MFCLQKYILSDIWRHNSGVVNMISQRIYDEIPSQMKIFEQGYPNSSVLLNFNTSKTRYLPQTLAALAT